MRTDHRKPRNAEDFEILSLKLLRAYWKCEQVERYSTSGGAQHGVDIIDLSGQEPLRGAQCKLHEEGKTISGDEILKEVEKAKEFTPPLGLYLILTSAKGNKDVHDTVIAINREHREKGLFEVQFMAWNRIEELLDQYTDVRDQYEGGLSATVTTRLESSLANIVVQLAGRTAEDKEDQFHGEIDEARDYLIKRDFQVAKLLLHRIRTRHEAQLNSRHRFRILTNLAAVAIGEDDWKKAGELYLEAKVHQPSDEMAQVNEALAYQILGDRERAFNLVNKLKDVYTTSERLFGILVHTAPDNMSFSELEAEVPAQVALKGEAAAALGQRAVDDGDLTTGEKYFRAATQSDLTRSGPWLLLGSVILNDETIRSWKMHGFEHMDCHSLRLAEAEGCFATGLSCARTEKSKQRTVEALLCLSRVRVLLGKEAEGRANVEEAHHMAPDDPSVVTLYGQSLRLQGNVNAAIEAMRRVPVVQLPHPGRMMLAMLLVERGSPADVNDAAEICVALAKDPATVQPDFREHVTEIALDSLARVSRTRVGHELLDELPRNTVSEIGITTLRAKLYRLEDKQELASATADEALKLVLKATSPHDIRRLSILLSEMGRHKDALPLWQQVTIPSVPSSDTRRLLECASRLGRHDIMLETFQALRNAGAVGPDLLEHELQLLETYDTAAAIGVMQQEIAKTGDKTLRLRLSFLGLALDRPELVEKDASAIPFAHEIPPRMGIRAVHVLRANGHAREAVDFAYQLVRRHFDDVYAHRTMLAALAPFDPDPDIKKPESVAPGTAVCYVEDGESVRRWVIVEESADPDGRLGEYPPDYPICKQMLGKKVGDKFILAEGIQHRTAQIAEILSKYVYRYQDCMGQWQVRFPGSRDIQMVRMSVKVNDSGEPEPDISAIKKSIDERYETVKKIHGLYQSGYIPIHRVAERLGTNTFEALRHLASEPAVTVKCCVGSADEREDAAKALADANRVVLDMSAISTLFTLRRLDVLESWPIDIVISQATDNELRQIIANEGRMHSHEAGVFMKTEQGYGMLEHKAEQKVAYVEELRQLVRTLEAKCKVVPCRALAALEPTKRDISINGFGNDGAEAIVLSSMPGSVLWTDDQTQAMVARSEHGALRVWTQLVIGARADSGTIEPESFFDASARLVGFGYSFTSISVPILRRAGVIADWKIGGWPFSQALGSLENESIDLSSVMQLAALFLKVVYMESLLPETQNAVTVQILEHIAKRKNGMAAIRALRNALSRVFGLNVVGFVSAVETIDAWLKCK